MTRSILRWLALATLPAMAAAVTADSPTTIELSGPDWRIHEAEAGKGAAAAPSSATINGKRFEQTLPEGLGVQADQPDHLAIPATAEFAIPADALRTGVNLLEVESGNGGWFTWDSLDLTESEPDRR